MLVLNEEREEELKNYGFEKSMRIFSIYDVEPSYFWTLGRSITIEGCYKGKGSGQIRSCSFSRKVQDMIYDLIMNGILIKVEEEEKKAIKIEDLEKRIAELEEKLKRR